MFRLYSHWVRNVPFPPVGLKLWVPGSAGKGLWEVMTFAVVQLLLVLPCQGLCELAGNDMVGRVNPLKKGGHSKPFQGFCGVQRSLSASLRAHLTSLPHLPHLAGSKDFAAPEQHTSLLHIFHEDFLTARVRINALRSSINLQETGLIFPTSFSMASLSFRKRDAHSSH